MLEINRLMAKILIVDDDTTFCIMLRKWLEKRGFDVDTAFSYKDAVKQLDKAGFDLVLTDLRLPDKDGIDLLRVIKEKMPKTQVLLMTGYADIQTAVTAIKLGAFDYVAKPVIPDEILKRKKFPFQAPGMSAMIKKPAKIDYLNEELIRKQGIFDADYVLELKKMYSSKDFKLMGAYEIDYLLIVMTVTMLCEQYSLTL